MAELKTVQLALPARTEDLRNLEIGSVAYLSGRERITDEELAELERAVDRLRAGRRKTRP